MVIFVRNYLKQLIFHKKKAFNNILAFGTPIE